MYFDENLLQIPSVKNLCLIYSKERVSTFEIRQLIQHGHINIHCGAKTNPSNCRLDPFVHQATSYRTSEDLQQHLLPWKDSRKFPHDVSPFASQFEAQNYGCRKVSQKALVIITFSVMLCDGSAMENYQDLCFRNFDLYRTTASILLCGNFRLSFQGNKCCCKSSEVL